MASRQEQLLDAAIMVLGTHGLRHLTHRAVDAAAGAPAGSTSNYFRTRDALVTAVVDRLTHSEQVAWENIAASVHPSTPRELAAALADFAHAATGPYRTTTLARYAIFVEAALRPERQRQLIANADRIRAWGAQWLHAVGSVDPDRDARLILNQLDGLMLHQLAFPDPDFDPGRSLSTLIDALTGRDGPA